MGNRSALRFGHILVAVLAIASVTACSRSGASANAKLVVTLEDDGLHFSPGRLPAGRALVSFVDGRSHAPAGQEVQLLLGHDDADSGLLLDAGDHDEATLLPHDVPTVRLNQSVRRVGHEAALTVEASPGYPRTLTVTLGDRGLAFSRNRFPAGRYLVSFVDRRSNPSTGQKVELQFGPSGPLIELVTVPLGRPVLATLGSGYVPWYLINDVRHYPEHSPNIERTPDFPTRAT